MIELEVREEGSSVPRRELLEGESLMIGRAADSDLVLPDRAVSTQHARLYRENGAWKVVDQKSTNGTWLNGIRLEGPTEIREGDTLAVGTFRIRMVPHTDHASAPELTTRMPRDLIPREHEVPTRLPSDTSPRPAPSAESPSPVADSSGIREAKEHIHRKLIEFLDLRWVDLSKLGDSEIRAQTRAAIDNILRDLKWQVPKGLDREALTKQILDEALGLGPLEDLLADSNVTEIMVNRYDQIYVERKGKLELSERRFTSNQAVLAAIERIVAPLGRRVDESSPMVDARLKDGSRVNAIIPPLALKGPAITIRKFNKTPLGIDDLARFGALTRGMANFLKLCVELRRNVIVAGGTGSGKTTLLNVLSSFIPHDERIVTAEDSAELKLLQEHVVSLETRPPNLEGTGAVTIRDLVRNALRMRPDRIVVGECRGGEALDMLQAMNTGHDGSMTTLHANSPRDAIARLETLVLMAGMDLPVRAIREQIAAAVHLIIQQARLADGSRKLTRVAEMAGIENEQIQIQDIFYFKQDGYTAEGNVRGRHVPTGYIPQFYEELRQRGLPVDLSIFRSEEA